MCRKIPNVNVRDQVPMCLDFMPNTLMVHKLAPVRRDRRGIRTDNLPKNLR